MICWPIPTNSGTADINVPCGNNASSGWIVIESRPTSSLSDEELRIVKAITQPYSDAMLELPPLSHPSPSTQRLGPRWPEHRRFRRAPRIDRALAQ